MTDFPKPIDPSQPAPPQSDKDAALAAAQALVEGASSAAGVAELLDAFEAEASEVKWRPMVTAMVSSAASAELFEGAVRRLKAVAVLDPSDTKRAAALEALVMLPTDRTPEWVSDFARERILSDESNYARATAASAIVRGSAGSKLFEFAAQWLRNTQIEPGGDVAQEWSTVEMDSEYFAGERRALLADELAVQTLRSRATSAVEVTSAGPNRRGGPTLVQGHHSHAGAAITVQRVLAAGLGGYGVYMLMQGQRGLGVGLLVGAVAWAAALQVWKWYKYG